MTIVASPLAHHVISEHVSSGGPRAQRCLPSPDRPSLRTGRPAPPMPQNSGYTGDVWTPEPGSRW